MAGVSTIYVTGHRNPDTDSIASAIGYAELKRRLDPRHDYVPVRLGDVNAQTAWVLERSGAQEPEFLPHIMLRVRDVMRECFPSANHREPIRRVGQTMAREDLELMPIVDDDGALAGVMTERTLARRYIRESREATQPGRRRRLGRRRSSRSRGRAGGRRGARDRRARVGAGHGRRVAARRDRRGRRRRRRRPARRPAPRDRARRRAAGHEQRHAAARRGARAGRASTARPSSARRWTAT